MLAAAAALLRAAACGNGGTPADPSNPSHPSNPTRGEAPRESLGFMSSLPIIWGEPGTVRDVLNGPEEPHWFRTELESRYRLSLLDYLGADDGTPQAQLSELRAVMIAQPRALTPADNTALDAWVRGGGRLLLVLDPMITAHSDYAIGDKRRFNDVALPPPVLARWGLNMSYAEDAPASSVTFEGVPLPVAEHGQLALTGSGHDARCVLQAEKVIATCRLGRGTATVVADAAFLDPERQEAGAPAAEAILRSAFR